LALDLANIARGAVVGYRTLAETLLQVFLAKRMRGDNIDAQQWNRSRYFPVPTIIEAASAIYGDHDVKEIACSRAGTENLNATQDCIVSEVESARVRGVKKLIIVTGVPGAGKTLAGLNAVQAVTGVLDPEREHASFLSGNGPLVAVLQEALKRSVARRKRGVARSVRARIRDMHVFVSDSYDDPRPPADTLVVFDEAQRAWTAAKNLKKFGRDVSEPEKVLEIMGRHPTWAVVVALVGGGQEIHGGEGGLAAWGDALSKYTNWEVVTSPEAIHGGDSVAGSRLFRDSAPPGLVVVERAALHLNVCRRSVDSEVTAAWVNAFLNSEPEKAAGLARVGLPIWVTRDLSEARARLSAESASGRRAGLIASSGADRLRADGVETPTFTFLRGIDYRRWFLEEAGDHRSSNQLEVAMSEFEIQGLEIDFAALLWGGDLVIEAGRLVARSLKGLEWQTSSGSGDAQAGADDISKRILNRYRVLLTRFRKGMVIFIPVGSEADTTRQPAEFDSVYKYLQACGVRELA